MVDPDLELRKRPFFFAFPACSSSFLRFFTQKKGWGRVFLVIPLNPPLEVDKYREMTAFEGVIA